VQIQYELDVYMYISPRYGESFLINSRSLLLVCE
jgi:hypothetical protein